jgi:hypothetical protein
MNAYTIPVAFLVEADDEHGAAVLLSDILAAARLTQDHRSDDGQADCGPIESWWAPNHPAHETGGSLDIEEVLVFAPGTTYTPVTQAMADQAVRYWRGVIEAMDRDGIPYPVCGESFMAGASCSLPLDHEGGHR